MKTSEQERRSFLFSAGGLAISQFFSQNGMGGEGGGHSGYLLGPDEGEHLIHFRDKGDIFIKAGAATGSTNLAMGTQQVRVGTGIPVHRHFKMDEAFYVLEGSGTFV